MRSSLGDNRVAPGRIRFFLAGMLVIFAIFSLRLIQMQVILGDYYGALAEDNRTQLVYVPSSRGVVYDRNGLLLARNTPAYNITLTPALLPYSAAEIETLYRKLSQLTGVPIRVPGSVPSQECAPGRGIADLMDEWIDLAPYYAVKIACDADPTVAKIILERAADLPGVGVEVSAVRDYPNGRYTAHLVGYMGRIPAELADIYKPRGYNLDRDKIGYAGVEAFMQNVLAGEYGSELWEVDAAGKKIRLLEAPTAAVPGLNIKLTIDSRLQQAATEILEKQIEETRAKKPEYLRSPMASGVVIAMNPNTGEILAMVSTPTYDNQRFSRAIPFEYYSQLAADISNPLLNHAISGTYPPGSVFKLATAVGALNEGIVSLDTPVTCRGTITVTQKFHPTDPGREMLFYCYDRTGHGEITFLRGLALSCDIYFYNLGAGYSGPGGVAKGLGIEGIKQYAEALGYDRPLGIELYGERPGLIPDPDWKRINQGENWATGDTYIATIGQGYVDATPLQVAESFAAIAAGGKVMKPTLIKEYLDGEGNTITDFVKRRYIDEEGYEIAEYFQDGYGNPVTAPGPVMLYDLADGVITAPYDVNIEPWVLQAVQQGMRMAVTEGTAADYAQVENIPTAGKTGTAEYCDDIAQSRNLCKREAWPTHAWYGAYGPYENPEIVVVAFVYDGGEGAVTAGPVVRDVLKVYFSLKQADLERGG
ncbi:MAG: penicillin-binding protein 2 [Anaerolineales bacterium]|nr:penicillin-binding protein 2 [Anaerolineales bacterium]